MSDEITEDYAVTTERIATILSSKLGVDRIATGDAIDERYYTDIMKKYHGYPSVLVRPRTTQEVSEVLQEANAHKIPVTVVGGQTGTSGGAIPSDGAIALSLDHMDTIEDIDLVSMTMTVSAGCILQVAQEAVEAVGGFLPLDLGSRGSATIGGVIGANAGGNRVLRWGMMRDMVIGLEVVLADGTIISSMTKMIKDNAGYHWKHLLIGSEGTLGIVTRAVLRLRPLPTTHDTALVAIRDFSSAVQLLRRLEVSLSGRLSSFELMWQDFYLHMTEVQLAKRQRPMAPTFPFYAVIEAMGGDIDHDAAQFERALLSAMEADLIEDAVIAKSSRERDALWAVREDMEQGIAQMSPFTVYDVSIALSVMEGFTESVRASVLRKFPDAKMIFYGHAGDGNLHIIISVGVDGQRYAEAVERIVYDEVSNVGGSISAEHGIGMSRIPYLSMTRTQEELALMRRIKETLDPHYILNPGKLLPPGIQRTNGLGI